MRIDHHRIVTIAISLAALGSLASCVEEDELGFGDLVDELELRAATMVSPDPLPQAARDAIAMTLPEGQNAPATHPELFPAGFDPNPEVVTPDTDVWVTFVDEGSNYENVLGYFTYPTGNPPTSLTPQELEDGVIFSHTQERPHGHRWHLGTFQPGVQIGFFLVRGGACLSGANCNTTARADFTQPTFFSVDSMNPEHATDPSMSRHVIMGDLLDDPAPDARMLAWEEKDRLSGLSDDDFNDLVVRVTATPALGGGDPPPVGGAYYRIDCLDILENGESIGDGHYTIDPDGAAGSVNPFLVYCDMTTDGGGWTMIGRGAHHVNSSAPLVDPNVDDVMLGDPMRSALFDIGNRVFRNVTETGNRIFIIDDEPVMGWHYWRTNSEYVSCGNFVEQTENGDVAIVATKNMSCDADGVADHQCGTSTGWILTHAGGPNVGFNMNGLHPCPTPGALESLWVRRGGVSPQIRQDCRDILDNGEAYWGDGVYGIDPDGPGGTPPFNVYCDMSTDGGGWTLIGRGQHQVDSTMPRMDLTKSNGLLEQTRRQALFAIGNRVFRHETTTGGQLFVVDNGPIFGWNYWRTSQAHTWCSNDVATTETPYMIYSGGGGNMSCDSDGVGDFACIDGPGWTDNGWLLADVSYDHLTRNASGTHPCPTTGQLTNLWVRTGGHSVYDQ